MKFPLRILFFFLLIVTFSQYAFSQEERNFYLWNTTGVRVGLSETYDLDVKAKIQYRTNDHLREFTYMDFTVSRDLNKWFNLGLSFRGAQIRKPSFEILEYRPQVITKIHFSLKKIKLSTTNRLEYRTFSEGSSYFRHYHNIFVNFPSITPWLDPYLGEELFTKLDKVDLYMTRIYSGLHLLNHDRFKLDAYYVWQSLESSHHWNESDILGLNLKFTI